jgi:hypothetical protein
MSKYVKIKVKQFDLNKLKTGDFFEYEEVVYKFLGYEYGTYPIGENVETGETINLPPF